MVLVNGEEATLKRIKRTDRKVILYAANPKYEPQIYDERDVRILGKVVQSIVRHD